MDSGQAWMPNSRAKIYPPLEVPELLDPVKRMFMIGPEGVRIAPAKHRLVIVMGSSPQNFFKAVDESLGEIAKVEIEQADGETARAISEEQLRRHKEMAAIQDLRLRLAEEEVQRGKAE